jgi:hypothetical protein
VCCAAGGLTVTFGAYHRHPAQNATETAMGARTLRLLLGGFAEIATAETTEKEISHWPSICIILRSHCMLFHLRHHPPYGVHTHLEDGRRRGEERSHPHQQCSSALSILFSSLLSSLSALTLGMDICERHPSRRGECNDRGGRTSRGATRTSSTTEPIFFPPFR